MASPKDATRAAATTPNGGLFAAQDDVTQDEIPLQLTLGDATLVMGASGHWELEHSPLQEYIAQIERLQEQNAKLEKENTQLKERGVRLTEESNMEKFKCQLLIEMLALSSLDEERSRGEAELERSRMTSLQGDLQSLMNEARKQGVDIRKLGAALSAP